MRLFGGRVLLGEVWRGVPSSMASPERNIGTREIAVGVVVVVV